MTARLIVISGLPGAGKTSVAEIVADRLRAVHLSIDLIEESMLVCGLPPGWKVGVAACEAARVMAELNLSLGRDVVIDAVNDSDQARGTWRTAASATGVTLDFVHLLVTDLEEHKLRLRGRDRGFELVGEPSWDEVQRRRADFAAWSDPVLEIDTSMWDAEKTAHALIEQLAARSASRAKAMRRDHDG